MAIQNIEQDIVREDHSEDGVWFDPCKDNVLFCSCHDNWAFSLSVFCEFYKDKIAIENLQESLWGESRYFHPDKKTIESTPAKPGQPHVSVQLLLDPIWRMYSTFLGEDSTDENRLKLTNKLKIPEKLWNNPRSDNRAKLKSVMGAWMPLAKCVLDTICREMDSPVTAQQRRLPGLVTNFADVPSRTKEALLKCDPSPDAPCVVYVCKLIDTQYLVGRTIGSVEEAENAFIGFARVYSGCLRTGQPIYLLSDGEQVQTEVRKVFLFRGAGLEEADEIYSGSLCGIGGLTSYICKHATISTEADIPPFKPLVPSQYLHCPSVCLPKKPKDADNLEKGLRLLYKVDPQVDVSVLPTGEHVIGTAGEVHAERCVKDLVETFAQVEIETSEPIVSFRETIVGPLSNKMRTHTVNLMDGAVVFSVCARPFPEDVLEIIKDDTRNVANDASLLAQLEGLLKENKRYSEAMESGIISCGPRRQGFVGAVLLADFRGAENPEAHASTLSEWKEAVVAGFQAAAESGPMAQEPLYGMAFIITELLIDSQAGLSGGMILPCVRDACRAAMELHPRRLVEPVYECTVYSAGNTQGRIYASLSRRRADIIEEVPNEGSDLFYIRCWLPAVEAFGLQDELRIQTQGASSTAQLQMSHWEIIEEDPYFVPTTKEEIEEHGKEVATKNIGEQLLERIQRRKGLFREKVVENAEKQKFSLRGA
ncbi:elongation factor 2 [Angomonas deanei]|nr:elongation factor 2 [Angomonas deanei]|eukprot:EPY26171.1 elongation factor 2 [Angomonas deanei]